MTTRDVATLGIRVDASEVRAGDQALDDFSQSGQQAEQQTNKTNAALERMTRMAKAVAGALAAMEVYEYIKEITLLGSRYNELGVVMGVIGRNAGISANQLATTEEALRKTGISALQSRDAIAKLISANIDLKNATGLARLAQDAAVIGGTNSSEAFERLIKGIQTAEKETLETMGLNVNFAQSYDKLAKSLGKKTDALTDSEKTQAALNAVMEKAPGIAGAYEASLTNAGKQMRSMSRYVEDLKVQLGQPFQNPFEGIIGAGTSALKFLTENVDTIRKAIQMTLDAFAPAVKIAAAYFALFVAAPAIYTAVAAAVWKVVSALAVYAMNVAIGQANTIGLNTALFGTSVAARLADGSLTKLGLTANLLFALFAGWQIGKYLDEQFVQVRVAGEIMAGGLLEAWERIKFGGKVAFDAITVTARATAQTVMKFYATLWETAAKGLRLIGKDAAAAEVDALAGRFRKAADDQGTFASRTAEARAEMVKNIKVIDQDTERRVREAFVIGQVSEATRGEAVTAKKTAETKKEITEAQKKAYDQAMKSSAEYLASLKQERDEVGKTDMQIRMMEAARAAADVPDGFTKEQRAAAAELRMSIMQNALALGLELEAQAELDRVRESAKSNGEALVAARSQEYLAAMSAVDAMQTEIDTYGMGAEAITRYTIAKLQAQQVDQMMTGDQGGADHTAKLIAAQEAMLILQGQKDALDTMFETSKVETFGDALRDAFGSAGSALGKLGDLLADYNDDSNKFEKARLAATRKYSGDEVKTAKAIGKINEAQLKERIGAYGDMAGAAKGFFKENTTGYKLMEGAERAFRLAELAMQMESLYMHLFVTGAKASATAGGQAAETAAVVTGEAARNTAKIPGVFMSFMSSLGPYGAAAAAVAIAAVLGGAFGGGGSKAPPVHEQRQKTQGTGSVFGDSSAKSDSIARSLELAVNNSETELDYTAAMARSLRNIESALGNLGNLAIRSGLNVTPWETGKQGFWGKLGNSIFGGKVTNEDVGFTAGRTTVAQAAAGGIDTQKYADMKKDGGWFSSNKRWTDTQSLGPEANMQFAAIINGMSGSIREAGKLLGLEGSAFNSRLDAFVIDLGKISLKNLSAEDVQKELEAVFSKLGDDMARFAVTGLDKFARAGEGYLETLVRIASNYANLDAIMQGMGRTFGAVGPESIAAREHLIDLAGGIDELASQASSFADDFLTEAERLAPVSRYVAAELAKMNLAYIDTRDEFKTHVLGLNLTTEAGREQYAAMMKLQGAFAKVTPEIKDMTRSMQDIADERADLQDQLDELTMTSTQLAQKQRLAIHESNRALFDQIQATEAQKEANDVLRDSMTASVERFREHARSLREFGADMLTGNLSTLTLEQQVAEAQSQYEAIASKALAGDEQALGQFQQAAQKFLELSQKVNGGDSRYSADFAAVQAMTERLAKYSDSRVDAATAQIDALERSIAATNALTAELRLQQLTQAATAPAAGLYPSHLMPAPSSLADELEYQRRSMGEQAARAEQIAIDAAIENRRVTLEAADRVAEAVTVSAPRRSPRADSYATLDR